METHRIHGEITLPRVVFIDTNILYNFSHGVSDADFAEIRDLCSELSFDICTVELCLREWVVRKTDSIAKRFKTANDNIQYIERLIKKDQIRFELTGKPNQDLEQLFRDYIKSSGIKIVPSNTSIDVSRLLESAISHEPPFEDDDKGFKDAILLSSLIKYMKDSKIKQGLFISNDDVFYKEQLGKHMKDNDLSLLVVRNLSIAKDELNDRVNEVIARYRRKKSAKIKQFVESNRDKIFEYLMRNAHVSEAFIKGIFSLSRGEESGLPSSAAIKDIRAVRPVDISTVSLGATLYNKGPIPEDYEGITIAVKTEFDLVIETWGFADLFSGPKVPIAAPEQFKSLKASDYYLPKKSETETVVERIINIEAIVKEEEGEYVDLQCMSVNTY